MIDQHSLSVDGRYRMKEKMDALLIAYKDVLNTLQRRQKNLDKEIDILDYKKETIDQHYRLH